MSSRKTARLLPLVLRATSQPAPAQVREIQTGLQAFGASGHRPCFFTGCQFPLRTFGSNSDAAAKDGAEGELQQIIKELVPVLQLQQDLKHEAKLNDSISNKRLVQMIMARHAARDETEAEEVSNMLQRVGVTIRTKDAVYLKPEEIYATYAPDFTGFSDLTEKLKDVERKLAEHGSIHAAAERVTARLLYAGWFILVAQIVVFYYLTFEELSWDVMEPIAYMLSLFYALVAYTYFLGTKGHVLDLKPFKESFTVLYKGWKLNPHAGKTELDDESYRALVKLRDNYEKRIKQLKKLHGS